MIKELDTIVLAKDLKEHHLKRGDVGAVVHIYESGKAFEVEFVTGEGETVAVELFQRVMFVPCGGRIYCMSARMRQRSAFRFFK